jgi:hypothetical protein
LKAQFICLIIMAICLFGNCTVNADALELIYNNKEIFYSMFNQNVGANEKRLYRFKGEDFFLNSKDKDFNYWQKNRDSFYSAFLNSISQICYFQKDGASVVNDSIYLLPLIELLKEPLYADVAIDKLTNNTSCELLNTYSEQIKKVLQKTNVTESKKVYLFALLKLSKKEIDSLQKTNDLPLEIKARLGDLQLCDSLKTNYLRATKYDDKINALKLILYVGSDDLIKFVLRHFYDPVYRIAEGNCIVESLRYPLLKGLQRYFPQEPFINCQVDYFHFYKLKGPDEEKAKELFKQINSWMKRKYNIEPTNTDCEPILVGRCIQW